MSIAYGQYLSGVCTACIPSRSLWCGNIGPGYAPEAVACLMLCCKMRALCVYLQNILDKHWDNHACLLCQLAHGCMSDISVATLLGRVQSA